METNIQVVFYSMYGHVFQMADAIAEGASQVSETNVAVRQVPELIPDDVLEESGADEARKSFSHVPEATVDELAEADGLLFGTPTRYGNMCAQMRNFLDQTGEIWQNHSLVGVPAGVFTSTATQHGGQETTITTFHTTLLHLGCVLVGVPYEEENLFGLEEVKGGSPYGASTIAGPTGERMPSDPELEIARFQGRYLARTAVDLKRGRR